MGVLYCKQPNGLYCRFSTVVDAVTDYNMDESELKQCLIDHLGKCDIDVINFEDFLKRDQGFHIYPFDEVVEQYSTANISLEEAIEIMKEMGYENPYWYPYVLEDEEKQFIIDTWAKLFVEYSDDEINDFLKKYDDGKFYIEYVKENDGKRYLIDKEEDSDNYGYKKEITA